MSGKCRLRATVTEGIRPDCVYMNQGFGHNLDGLEDRLQRRRE